MPAVSVVVDVAVVVVVVVVVCLVTVVGGLPVLPVESLGHRGGLWCPQAQVASGRRIKGMAT